MAAIPVVLKLYAVLFVMAAMSSFTVICSEEASKSEEHTDKDASVPDDSSNQDDSKEKRSREEIMFGNQQNKPNGLVDDLMGMADNADEDDGDSLRVNDKKDNVSQADQKKDEALKEKDGKVSPHQGDDDGQNDMMMGSGAENWYNTVPVSSSALQYLSNAPALQNPQEYSNSLYDQEDLYRRKRQLLGHPLPLRKRSLRSSLGQMIQKRGIRMPRRSMRLKRQVDMEDLLSLFGNERYYDNQGQVNQQDFVGREQKPAKRHVPVRYSGYPETPAPEYRYPYAFQHKDEGLLSAGNEMEDNNDAMDGEGMEDIDNLMLLPPNSRYAEAPEMGMLPYRTREEENEAIQKWLSRHTTPSVFSVSRRASPYFYPLDYRYIPAYTKRSRFSNGNRQVSRYSGDDEQDADFGKWGHVVQVPEAYASAEDVARLYGLANLMAEGDESEAKMRRSA